MGKQMNGSGFGDFVGVEALARVKGEGGLYSRLPSVAYTDDDFLALEYRRWLARRPAVAPLPDSRSSGRRTSRT